jgi:hypothetical protein
LLRIGFETETKFNLAPLIQTSPSENGSANRRAATA